jgi:hypothetical protein
LGQLARRLEPAVGVLLPDGVRIDLRDDAPLPDGARVLSRTGGVVTVGEQAA